MSVRIEGFKGTEIEKLKGVVAFQLNSAARSVEVLGRELAPVDTGFMRDHITQTETASDESLRAVTESEADYSVYVEYGTVNAPSQPFMTPAFESAKRQLLSLRGVF